MVGTPAILKKPITEEELKENQANVDSYVKNASQFLDAGLNHTGIRPFLDFSI
jgi:hypothetical protein